MPQWSVPDVDGVSTTVGVDGVLVVLDERRLTTDDAETLRWQLAAAIREARES